MTADSVRGHRADTCRGFTSLGRIERRPERFGDRLPKPTFIQRRILPGGGDHLRAHAAGTRAAGASFTRPAISVHKAAYICPTGLRGE